MSSPRTLRIGLTLLLAAQLAPIAHAVPKPGKLGPNLFLAISKRDPGEVRSLLARGADPDARNFLQMTPLMFAAVTGQLEIARGLVAAGAKLEAECLFGTSLTFAAMGGSAPVTRYLIQKGASVRTSRPDGISVLMLAARSGDVPTVAALLGRKVAIDARDNDGGTALVHAARSGKVAVVKLLLQRGAVVDAADSQGWTALVHAGLNGHLECVRLLLGKGADPNVRDRMGRSPLIVVASYGDRPGVLAALLNGGADPGAKDSRSRTALALATARGRLESAEVLGSGMARALPAGSPEPDRTARAAASAGLSLIEHSMKLFSERTGCVSCHHEGLGRMATGMARERGYKIDPALARLQYERIAGMLTQGRPRLARAVKDPRAAIHVDGVEIREFTPMIGSLLAGVAAHRQPPSALLADAAVVLAQQQEADGRWDFVLPREPLQSSPFTMTALSIRVLRSYAPRERSAEMAGRIRRARRWLLSARAESTEDQVFRLLGLKWAGAGDSERQKAIAALRAGQRPDGGWGQRRRDPSDAYATGQALYALNQAGGIATSDPTYRQGASFLLRTQDDDGSWYVGKRAMPANNYFDAGFPHGQAQYASFDATCWAIMALMLDDGGPTAVAGR